jgi:hypothetical protein
MLQCWYFGVNGQKPPWWHAKAQECVHGPDMVSETRRHGRVRCTHRLGEPLPWVGRPPGEASTIVDVRLLLSLVARLDRYLHYWLVMGDVPAFVRFDGSMFLHGPVWRLELTTVQWLK